MRQNRLKGAKGCAYKTVNGVYLTPRAIWGQTMKEKLSRDEMPLIWQLRAIARNRCASNMAIRPAYVKAGACQINLGYSHKLQHGSDRDGRVLQRVPDHSTAVLWGLALVGESHPPALAHTSASSVRLRWPHGRSAP